MSSPSTPRTWLVTGANKGLGLELVRVALSHGERVVAAVRTPSAVPDLLKDNPSVSVIKFDLSFDQKRMDEFAAEAVKAFGRVDVLVNMAGWLYGGGVEETT
jgi:NAD(P)-dependent dehydrogenase (short-subunit alcohol dehydrogenase family)